MTELVLPRMWLDEPMVSGLGPDRPGFALPVGTVTFLLTDIEGSTRQWETAGAVMGAAVARHYELLDEAVSAHHGVRPVEQGEGDSVVAAFSRASDAAAAAIDAQRSLAAESWPEGASLRVRMALHTGEAELRDEGNYFGPAVIRCARLRAIGHGGQVLCSGPTADLIADRLPVGAVLRDLGAHRLRDLGRPERVFELVHADLPGGFGPLASLDALPNNLPVQLTSFVGRSAELAELADLLAGTRLLTLNGVGGCGKTRTALQLAADVVDRYPGGAWLAELAPVTDPDRVAATIAAALGERDLAGDIVEVIVGRIGDDATLVVLDNCEHLLGPIAQLTDTLLRRCPGLTVVATSREPLGVPGESAWRIPSLSLPERAEPIEPDTLTQYDAVRLFLDRATRSRANFALTATNAPAIAQICARLDGIPLAIELAAARVRGMTVEAVATGLDDRFRLLTGGARTVLPRQQTLQASVDWGYALLEETERAAFRRLSVFAGGFTLDAAEAVVAGDDLPAVEVLSVLLALVDKSMIVADDTGRYRLLETLRQYGAVRLVDTGETTTTRDRHLAWASTLFDPIDEARRGYPFATIDVLALEVDNLRAALDWACLNSRADEALLVATGLVRWEAGLGDAADGATAGARALELPTGDAGLRVMCLAAVDRALFEAGQSEQRAAFLEQMLGEAHALGDDLMVAVALARAASTGHAGNIKGCEESLVAARRSGAPGLIRLAASMLAVAQAQLGDVITIDRSGPEVDVVDGPSVRNWRTADVVAARITGRLEACRDLTMELFEAPKGAPLRIIAWAATILVWVDLAEGREPIAAEVLEGILEAARRRNHQSALDIHGGFGGIIPLARGELDVAVDALVSWRRRAGFQLINSNSWSSCSVPRALLATGRLDEAQADLAALRSVAATRGPLVAVLDHLDGLLHLFRGELGPAEDCAHRALAAQHAGGWRPDLVHTLEGLSAITGAAGSHPEAARLAGAAKSLRDEMGYVLRWPPECTLVDAACANARAALGDAAFETAFTEGQSAGTDGIVAYASRARGERARPTTGWASLTPTEADVARRAAEGLTNREIGERLFMSAETVKTHLGRVYAKLGVRGRVELATVVPPA